ncbi:uncharacterized protein [Littorina saxatilis]|uniref:uncharacterized protein isoform X2 n=1 Tax=Littorina saxatilis TaxID=31220 RepID=UPI0038B562D9
MADTLVELLPVGQLSDRPLPTAEADPVEETMQENVDSLPRQTDDDMHQEIEQEDVPQPVSFIPVFIDSEAVEKMSVKTEFSFKANSVSRYAYNLSDDEGDARSVGSDDDDGFDPVFEEIKNSLNRAEEGRGRTASVSSQGASDEDSPFGKVSEQYTNIPYGIQPRDTFEHGRTQPDIMGVCYNGRMRQFIFLDSKGIVSWKRDRVDNRVVRSLTYPRHEYRLITYLVYARKHNCYFALGRDFSLKVLNRDFVETCSISADLRSVLFMLFNPLRDELITGGVQGIKVYLFHQTSSTMIGELKPLANYQLTLRYALPNVGGSWVKKVELDYNLEHLYCCSDTDLHVYNLDGKQLFQFQRAHTMSITGCRYSVAAKLLVTSSLDTEVKVWSMTGGLVHTFRGHSRPVTNLLIHPHNFTIIITCSLDSSLRMWSLDTMDEIYSLTVSTHGLLWMGLTDDNLLYLSTARSLSLWHLNHFIHFWSMTRNQVTRLQLEGCAGKTKRVVAVGEDSSIRLFARSNHKNLSTVLPPPNVSPLQKILGVCYSREFNVIFVLINPTLIWVYTTRTDPACRIAVWNVIQIQSMGRKAETSVQDRNLLSNKPNPTHRATESGVGNELPCTCQCVCILKSSAMLWTDEGCCCPVRHSYLLLGMEDGRVLFMDPVVKGQKFMEFKVSKDPVVGIHHDVDHQCLVTMTKVTQLILVQFWSLPDLDLQHEVFCPPDLSGFSRIGYTCVTAHESGYVLFHTLELANDPGFHKGRIMPEVEDVVDQNHHPEHMAPVINVDVCVSMKIFCTCSNDGAIKIWEEDGALLTEIMLDETLSAACFLNKSADMIIAFQKHIFFIHHTKVCPHLEPIEPEDLTFDKESYVYEDPAVAYEGFVEDPDPIDLETYLVPYEIEFSKDFLEGKVNLEPSKEETVESDEEDKLSFAPTEIYDSRPSTPGSLSAVDLTLRSEVTKYDLLQQMKSTLQTLIEKQKKKTRRKGVTTQKDGVFMTQGDEAEDLQMLKGEAGGGIGRAFEGGKLQRRFEFPTFDGSPGPTPTITPSSSPEPLSEESEEEESDIEEQIKDKLPPKKIPDMQLVAGGSGQSKVEKGVGGQDSKDLSMPATKRTRKAIADVEIDVASLMKGRRAAGMAVAAVKKDADHSHVGQSSADQREKPHRTPVKKKTVLQHKRAPPREKKRRSPTHEDEKRTAAENHGNKSSDDDAHNTQEESNEKEHMMETISVDISVVPSPTPERPASSKSGKSVDGLRVDSRAELGMSPTGEMYNQSETSASVRDTAGGILNTEEKARGNAGFLSRPETGASASDAGYFAGPRSPSVLSEGEELHRLKSQASWVSSREEFGQYTGAEEDKASSLNEADDYSHQPQTPVLPTTPTKLSRLGSQGSDAVFEQYDLDKSQGQSDEIFMSPRLPPTTPSLPQSPRQRFSSASSSRHGAVFSPVPLDVAGRDSVLSGAAGPASIADSISEREMFSPDSCLPDAELVSISQRASSGAGGGEMYGGTDEDEHRAWSRIGLPDTSMAGEPGRPATTLLPARHIQQLEGLIRQRPYTAGHSSFQAEELKSVFETALHRYQQIHGDLPGEGEKLYRNTGVHFEDKWYERVLERHMLLRMQRLLRAHAAQQRRQMLLQQRVKSAPQHKAGFPGGLQQQEMPSKLSRPKTAHPSILRTQTPTPAAPSSSPAGSRPQTAAVGDRVPSMSQQRQIVQETKQQMLAQREKQQLGEEVPFRLRLTEPEENSPRTPREKKVAIDPWLLDPRNPSAVRPRSSKSIPSKCSRYVLLSRPRTAADVPTPSPLEEELLATRFPEQSVRLLQSAGSAIRPTPPHTSYGITYTPFSMYG